MAGDHPEAHQPSVAVIIPALNESKNVASLVREILAQPVDWVIVVDNGSTDNTGSVAEKAGAVAVHEPSRGYGYACAAGSRKALEHGADLLVYIDGDHSSPPHELTRLIGPLLSNEADLVLGSRALGDIEAGAMHAHQRLGNRLAAWLTRRLYGVSVTDLGPYRAIRADLYRRLDLTEMTYGWPTEMTVKSIRHGARLVEVPASWRARREGSSKVSGTIKGSVLAGYHILRVTIRYARRGGR